MSELTGQEQDLLNHYRETIMSMSYGPLSDGELAEQIYRRNNAEACAAIEGLNGNPMNSALFNLFEELRAPENIYRIILTEYIDQQLSAQ